MREQNIFGKDFKLSSVKNIVDLTIVAITQKWKVL